MREKKKKKKGEERKKLRLRLTAAETRRKSTREKKKRKRTFAFSIVTSPEGLSFAFCLPRSRKRDRRDCNWREQRQPRANRASELKSVAPRSFVVALRSHPPLSFLAVLRFGAAFFFLSLWSKRKEGGGAERDKERKRREPKIERAFCAACPLDPLFLRRSALRQATRCVLPWQQRVDDRFSKKRGRKERQKKKEAERRNFSLFSL